MKKEFRMLRIVAFVDIFLICISLHLFNISNIKDVDMKCIENCNETVNWTAMKIGMATTVLTIVMLIIYVILYVKLVTKKSKIKNKRHI